MSVNYGFPEERFFTDDDYLLIRAFSSHYKSNRPGSPERIYSSVATYHADEGSEINFACVSDHRGLLGVYKQTKANRVVPLHRWPLWIQKLDTDPEWRRFCRETEAKRRRTGRRRMARLENIIANLLARSQSAAEVTSLPEVVPLPEAAVATVVAHVDPITQEHEQLSVDDLAEFLAELDRMEY